MNVERAEYNHPLLEPDQGSEVAGNHNVLELDSSASPSVFRIVKEGLSGIVRPVKGRLVVSAAVAALTIAVMSGSVNAHVAEVGDVDCDGEVTSADALSILLAEAGYIPGLECEYAADVNKDGLIGASDALLILQFHAGLIDSLPCDSSQGTE